MKECCFMTTGNVGLFFILVVRRELTVTKSEHSAMTVHVTSQPKVRATHVPTGNIKGTRIQTRYPTK